MVIRMMPGGVGAARLTQSQGLFVLRALLALITALLLALEAAQDLVAEFLEALDASGVEQSRRFICS